MLLQMFDLQLEIRRHRPRPRRPSLEQTLKVLLQEVTATRCHVQPRQNKRSQSFPHRGPGSCLPLSFQPNISQLLFPKHLVIYGHHSRYGMDLQAAMKLTRRVCTCLPSRKFPLTSRAAGSRGGCLFGKVCSSDSDVAGRKVDTSERIRGGSYLLFMLVSPNTFSLKWSHFAPGHTRPLAPSQTHAVSNPTGRSSDGS